MSRQDIVVGYRKAESQNQWEKFLADICKRLNVDFIFTILDRSDNAPVWRLVHGFHYFTVRQSYLFIVVYVCTSILVHKMYIF